MTTKKLHISDSLALPLDAVTSTLVVYGGKGMGKTNFAGVLVEEFAAAGLHFAVIDPMGVWWGLRHDADGKGLGVEALIVGGIHGDLPIEPTSGAVVADLVVDEDANVIIDISRRPDGAMWAIAERVRFVTAFAKRLYQRQGERRRPINLVIDEAARFAPQIVRQGETDVAACMGAIAVIVEEGRNVGIGVTLVTQRSARLNKDVAELADCLVAFRIVGPNSMRAVLDWLGEHVDKARLKDIGEHLRSLPRGAALVISPGWLEHEGIVAIRKRRTFDSSKTPEAGKEVRAAGAGAKPDLAKYRARLAEVVEQAKANDPKALKARVAELEKQLAAKAVGKTPAAKAPKVIERPIIGEAGYKRLERTVARFEVRAEKLDGELQDIRALAVDTLRAIREAQGKPPATVTPVPPAPPPRRFASPQTGRQAATTAGSERRSRGVTAGETALPPGERATLAALIQYTAGLDRSQLRVLTAYKRSSSDAYIARLREKGLVEVAGDTVRATREGVQALPDAEPLPTGPELQAFWFRQLPAGEGEVLKVLVEAHPDAVERTAIDERTGFKRSTRDAYLSRLAARELVVDAGRGAVRASATLFEVSP